MRKIALIILFVIVFSYLPKLASAAETEEDAMPGGADSDTSSQILDVVTTWDELSQWLDDNKDTGGTVALSANIEAEFVTFPVNSFTQPITIDTGPYGFIFGESVNANDFNCDPNAYLTIKGEGVDTPVISDVWQMGVYSPVFPHTTVIAYGRGGQGGTAVYSNRRIEMAGPSDAPRIYSYGAGSVGIACDGSADIAYLTVESDGTAVQAEGALSLFACHLKGGLSGSEIMVDTCAATDVTGATVIQRKVSSVTGGQYFILGKPYAYQIAGQPVNEDWFSESHSSNSNLSYTVSLTAEGAPDKNLIDIPVAYDHAFIDTQTIGAKTALHAHILKPFDDLDILPDDTTLDMTVETVDGRVPHFIKNLQSFWSGYVFFYSYAGENLGPLTLWRSDDSGASWYKIWKEDDPELTGAAVNYGDEIISAAIPLRDANTGEPINQAPFLLAFETDGLTGEQVIYFNPATGGVSSDISGDRDGGDRMILPWEVFTGTNTDSKSSDSDRQGEPNSNGVGDSDRQGEPNSCDTGDSDRQGEPNSNDIGARQDNLNPGENDESSTIRNAPDPAYNGANMDLSKSQDTPYPAAEDKAVKNGENLVLEPTGAIPDPAAAGQQSSIKGIIAEVTPETTPKTTSGDAPDILIAQAGMGTPKTAAQQDAAENAQSTASPPPPLTMSPAAAPLPVEPPILQSIPMRGSGFPFALAVSGTAIMAGAGGLTYLFRKRWSAHK